MKSKEELNTIKLEIEALNNNVKELNEEELEKYCWWDDFV